MMARTAARGYLSLLIEMKKASGASGCPLSVAMQTLQAVIDDMQSSQVTAAVSETQTVSLGALGQGGNCGQDCSEACRAACQAAGKCSEQSKN